MTKTNPQPRAWSKLIPLIVFCYFTLDISSQTLDYQQFNNESIWYSGTFRGERVGGIRSMNDGKHYTSLERNESGSSIVKYSYKTGLATDTLATSKSVFEDASKGFDGYEFSADESMLMLTTESEGIYRHSYLANYYVFDIQNASTKPLTDFEQGKQRLAAFSPSANEVAFVRDNNIFIANITSSEEIQVTTDGEFNSIINGAADWVY